MLSRLDTYVFGRTALNVAIASAAMCIGIIMIDFVEQLRTFASVGDGAAPVALRFTLMRLPGILELALPFAVLVGAITTFLQLSRRSEITAMRAAGISAWRFLSPAAGAAASLALGVIVILGPLAASLNATYERDKAAILSGQAPVSTTTDAPVWMTLRGETGPLLVRGRRLDADRWAEVSVFEYRALDNAFERRIEAGEARKIADRLRLTGATEYRLGADPVALGGLELTLTSGEGASRAGALPRDLPLWDLPAAARRAADAGASPEPFLLRFHRLLTLPVTFVAMALIAGLLSLGVERLGGRARMIAIAASAGLGIYFLTDLAGAAATAGFVAPWAAAWCPALLTLMIALGVVSHREDG
jgi:lipopolysaccharide export system permease protein